VYKQDPTVIELESSLAAMFGMEAAFFLRELWQIKTALSYIQPGEQIIADKYAHVYLYEGGGASFIAVFLLFA
jgi:threonine aldolase